MNALAQAFFTCKESLVFNILDGVSEKTCHTIAIAVSFLAIMVGVYIISSYFLPIASLPATFLTFGLGLLAVLWVRNHGE